MGSVGKKLTKVANKFSPHALIMGEEASASMDLGGQLFGAHDDLYKPKNIEAIPGGANMDASAMAERDRARRLARRAMGRDSTVRTGAQGAAYQGAPKTLIGS